VLSASEGNPEKGSRRRSPSSAAVQRRAFEREFPAGSQPAAVSLVALARTCTVITATLNHGLRCHGLSATGRQALAAREGAGHPLSPATISERRLVTTASMASSLDTLPRRGPVVRQAAPRTGTSNWSASPPTANHVVDERLPEIVALQSAMMAKVSEGERRQLLGSPAAIVRRCQASTPQAVLAGAPGAAHQGVTDRRRTRSGGVANPGGAGGSATAFPIQHLLPSELPVTRTAGHDARLACSPTPSPRRANKVAAPPGVNPAHYPTGVAPANRSPGRRTYRQAAGPAHRWAC